MIAIRHTIFVIALFPLLVSAPAFAETVEVTGGMSTSVNFQDQIAITVPTAIRTLTVTVPTPSNINLFGYSQAVGDVTLVSSRTPDQTHPETDALGNKYTVDVFKNPQPGTINFSLSVAAAKISVDLHTPLPYCPATVTNIPQDVAVYLKPTDKVQSQDPVIVALAHQLAAGATDEATITTHIQEYLQKNITYYAAANDDPDDALYVLKNKKSLCDGWAHLFLALARADALPARFVGGYNIGGDIIYPVDAAGRSTLTVSSLGEAHSWVEVWFPSVGWVPFEPQASAGFVDSHHLTAWTGTDSDAVESILSWTSSVADSADISMTETENPSGITDQVNVEYFDSDSGPGSYTTLARRREPETVTPKL
jgi:transglutaminase-like putative cysteine protease